MGRGIVLGAGPCGLCAAWTLAQQAYQITVLEKEGLVGGLCQTVNYQGFRFDLGGHRFIYDDPKLIGIISQLLNGALLQRHRKSIIKFQGQDLLYPLTLSHLLKKLPVGFLARIFKDYLKNKTSNSHSNGPLEGWLTNKYGPTLYTLFFKTYSSKLWGISPDGMAPDWAVERIPPLRPTSILLSLFGKKNSFRHYAAQYLYPKEGIGQIFQEMARHIKYYGGDIWLNSTVEKIYLDGNQVKAVEIKKDKKRERLELDWLVATIPLPGLITLLHPRLAPELTELAHWLRYRSLRFLNLLIDSPGISDNTWIYVPDKDFIIGRIQEPRNRSPYNAPPGFTSLIVEIPCSVGDHTWQADAQTLYQHCLDELRRLGIDLTGRVIDYFFTQAEYAYPIYHLGYQSARQPLIDAFNALDNMLLVGRQAQFQYLFMDQVMCQGIEGARQIMQGAGK